MTLGPCHANVDGFDLHARIVVPAGQRERLRPRRTVCRAIGAVRHPRDSEPTQVRSGAFEDLPEKRGQRFVDDRGLFVDAHSAGLPLCKWIKRRNCQPIVACGYEERSRKAGCKSEQLMQASQFRQSAPKAYSQKP
jgi:hypothetical protein